MAAIRPFWWITALAGGVLAGLALPPLGLPPLLWLALVPLWALPPLAALAWAAAAVLVSHAWLLWLHPLDWVGVPLALSLPLCLLLWAGCAAVGALLVGAWRLLVQRLGPERPSTALLASALWGLAEVLLAKGPLFWLGLGSAALPGDRALAAWAQWVGAGGLASLQLLLGWGLWRLGIAVVQQRRTAWRWAGGWLTLVLLLHLQGWSLLSQPLPQARSEAVLVLQPAIPTRSKFSWEQQQRLLQRLAQAQGQAQLLAADRLVLPEGALPLGQELPQPAPVEVLSGGFRQVNDQLRSSLLVFAPGAQSASAALDKHRLVPLGEWLPWADLVQWAGLSAVGGVQPGAPPRLLPRADGALVVAICYEIADGAALAAGVHGGGQWLLASANLDPYPALLQQQFSALAQLRAIETGRWLVSAANTGPSLVIDPVGRVRQQLPVAEPGTLLARIEPLNTRSGYVRWGELPLLLLAGLGLARLACENVEKS